MLIRYLLLAARMCDADYAKDPNPDNWRTINGARVHVDGEGNADGGAGGRFNGNKFGEDWRASSRSALMRAAGIFKEKDGTKIKGSEKQVKWANDLVGNILNTARKAGNGHRALLQEMKRKLLVKKKY